ncbi:MAG: zeta toxin family protein [Alphaproteobacteria bacterium]|nr:zeta toxin family protein [Alphaproteobacteria bacterium]
MTENVNPYQLRQEVRDIWYDAVLEPLFLSGLKTSKRPKFTLITGQSGCGKTTAALRCAKEASPMPLRFSGDDIRKVHPNSERIMREDPDNYVKLTTPDVSWARSKVLEECMKRGLSIQIDSVLTNPEDYRMKTLLQTKEYGYKTECVALGVPYFLSVASMYYRREKQIEQTGHGFPVTMWNHDTAFEYLPGLLSKMYEGGYVDKVRIVDRQFRVFFEADHAKNQSGEGMAEALDRARNSYIRTDCLAYVDGLWREIRQMMDKRNAPENHYQAADEQYKSFADLCRKTGLYSPQTEDGGLGFQLKLQALKESNTK